MTQWSGPFVGWRREREPMAASDVTLAHTLCCRPLLPLKAAIYSPLSPYILSLSPISILSSLSLSLSRPSLVQSYTIVMLSVISLSGRLNAARL
jgi:hypothetical protein